MTRGEVMAYIEKTYGVKPVYPWKVAPENAVFRHKDTGKWFAVVMPVRRDKLGYEDMEYVDVVTMKCDPFLIDGLVQTEGYHRGYHMNKSLWLTAELNWNVPNQKIESLLDMSFQLTGGIN